MSWIQGEAKYCAFFIHGEPKYYVCPRTEYCCNFGCCISPGFQIYHLWYYWLLVILMFLVCSGGGWWYRYWLQGRYRAGTTRSYNSRTQHSFRGPACQAQQARISYNSARNTVLLHRMWKSGPHARIASPGAYNHGAGGAGSTHYQNTSVVLSESNCPYYQFYRPPPSYETVIGQKTDSPEQSSRIVLQSPAYDLGPESNPPAGGPLQGPHHPHHHSFQPPPEICHSPHCPINFRFYKRSLQKFATVNEENNSETEQMLGPESSRSRDKGVLRIGAEGPSAISALYPTPNKDDLISGVDGQSIVKSRPTRSRSFNFLTGKSDGKLFTVKDRVRYETVGSDEAEDDPASRGASCSQSNPSNNVILASSNSTIDVSADGADQRRLLHSFAQESATDPNLESNCKLDRSRSLD